MTTPRSRDEEVVDFRADGRWFWLESTRTLQREVYGIDLDHMTVEDRAMWIKENVLAAVDELTEILHEISWKFWAHDDTFVNRDGVLKEAVDLAHFLGNIVASLGVTDAEWERAYQTKQFENARRQREGYEVKDK